MLRSAARRHLLMCALAPCAARQWRQLPADTRSLISVGVGFVAIPVLVSASLRLTVIDPLLFYLQADMRNIDLTRAFWQPSALLFACARG
jgi:hypothetical protein